MIWHMLKNNNALTGAQHVATRNRFFLLVMPFECHVSLECAVALLKYKQQYSSQGVRPICVGARPWRLP